MFGYMTKNVNQNRKKEMSSIIPSLQHDINNLKFKSSLNCMHLILINSVLMIYIQQAEQR